MGRLIVKWLAVFLAVFGAAYLLPDRVFFSDWQSLAIFAAVLALINAILRPVLNIVTWPLTCLTFGLFALVVNGFTFWLAIQLVPGVDVASFLDAVIVALIVSLVSAILDRAL